MANAEVQQIGSSLFNLITKALEDKGIDAERFNELQSYVGKRERIALGDNVFEIGQPWAADSRFTVFDYFEDLDKVPGISGDIRVFLIPTTKSMPCMRITLNAVCARRHLFDETAFADLIARDWEAVADVLDEEEDDSEEETITCTACGTENWELMPLPEDAEEDDEQQEARHCSGCGVPLVKVEPS